MVSKKADQIKKLHRDGCFHVQLGRDLNQTGVLQSKKKKVLWSIHVWLTHHSYSLLCASVKISHLIIRFGINGELAPDRGFDECVQEAACTAKVLFSTSHCELMHVADLESVLLLSRFTESAVRYLYFIGFERTHDMSDILNIHPLLTWQLLQVCNHGKGYFPLTGVEMMNWCIRCPHVRSCIVFWLKYCCRLGQLSPICDGGRGIIICSGGE